jgi:hypothetical protein
MAEIEKIRVMVSSRSLVKVFKTGDALSDVRTRLQTFLRSIRWSAASKTIGRKEPIFNVWIHEDETGLDTGKSTFQISLDEVDRADIVLVLYTGESGSVSAGSSLGICHAELQAAISRRPEIVFMVRLLPLNDSPGESGEAFRAYVDSLSLFQKDASSENELHTVVAEMIQNVTARLVMRGSSTSSRKLDRGEALEWSRLNLADRRSVMRKALAGQLGAVPLAGVEGHPLFSMPLSGVNLMVRLDAIPAAATEPAAREMVGQPFLRDHVHATSLEAGNLLGPVHVIACHRTITERQAAQMLGTPDSMIVASDFGIFAADHVQKIQVALLARCSDENATAVAVRRFTEWLMRSGEGQGVIERARSRRRILSVVAGEQSTSAQAAPRPRRRTTR